MLQPASGPEDPAEALAWIQEAVAEGRYAVHEPHFSFRCAERKVALADWKKAIRDARSCVSHPERTPTCGGTNWRVTGPDTEGDDLMIGVERYQDHLGRRALLITVM
jgi:hypothetical protein